MPNSPATEDRTSPAGSTAGVRWKEDVLATDPFAGDFGEPGDRTLSDKIVTARKGGECQDCAQPIVPGTLIRSRTDVFDGDLMSFRWCHECCNAMALSWTDNGKAWDARVAMRFPHPAPAAVSQDQQDIERR